MLSRILLDSNTDLDMPPEMTATSKYCATLGHKVILNLLTTAMVLMLTINVECDWGVDSVVGGQEYLIFENLIN